MRIVTAKSLKDFLLYLRTKFVSPYASKDDEGNEIKTTYLRADSEAIVEMQKKIEEIQKKIV